MPETTLPESSEVGSGRPNFVVVLTDDQGYGDLSCMGSEFATPNLDAVAAAGVRFTSWYSGAPVCSPARASLLTGRYPGGAGVRNILAGHRTATGMPDGVATIADALGELGYRRGLFGKWHLGVAEGYRPEDRGFDSWFGFLAGCVDYYSHIYYWGAEAHGKDPAHDLWEDGREIFRNGQYLTEAITEAAVGFIEKAVAEKSPFLAYVAYNAPHYPMHAPVEYLDRFRGMPPDRRIMAAMLSAVDDGIGKIRQTLQRLGVEENTCIVFTSDNGPSRETRNWLDGRVDPYYGGSAGGLKGHKFSLFEGGIRVPGLLSWPARVPGGQVVDHAVASMDVMPTLLRAAGGDPTRYDLDGIDMLPLLTRRAQRTHEELCWEMGDQLAVRQGPWKLVLNGRLVEQGQPVSPVFLADLDADPGERINHVTRAVPVARELEDLVRQWHHDLERRCSSLWQGRDIQVTGGAPPSPTSKG